MPPTDAEKARLAHAKDAHPVHDVDRETMSHNRATVVAAHMANGVSPNDAHVRWAQETHIGPHGTGRELKGQYQSEREEMMAARAKGPTPAEPN